MSDVNLSTLCALKAAGNKALLDWCADMGLISREYTCPECNNPMRMSKVKRSSEGYAWRCRRNHFLSRSARTGTIFMRSHVNMIDILFLTYFWVHELPFTFAEQVLKAEPRVIYNWNMYCREICLAVCEKEINEVGGEGIVVEIGEAKFRNRAPMKKAQPNTEKKKTGPNLSWVLGAVEQKSKKCIFRIQDCRSRQALLEMIETHILPGTIIISNCWRKYSCFNDENFKEKVAERKIELRDYDDHQSSKIAKILELLRESLKQNNNPHNIEAYMAEYVWRRNNPRNCFSSFLKSINKVLPAPTNDVP